MFAVGVDVSNGRSTVAVLGARRKVVMKPFEVPHTADGFHSREAQAHLSGLKPLSCSMIPLYPKTLSKA